LGVEGDEKNQKASTKNFGNGLVWPARLPVGVDLIKHWVHVLSAMALAFPVWICFILFSPGYACCNVPDFSRFLVVVCITPVAEEIIFRGAIQTMFEKRFNQWEWAILSAPNLLTSIVFGAIHFLISFRPSALLVFFPGLVFGYLREKQKSLAAPMLVHAFYNFGFILIAPA
jgi:membrane protease YdiL (CAAX protease family)